MSNVPGPGIVSPYLALTVACVPIANGFQGFTESI